MRAWALAEQNHAFIRSQKWEVAVLPFGATEPHNLHMPYGTDNYQVDVIGSRACERAYRAGAKVLLLPTVPPLQPEHRTWRVQRRHRRHGATPDGRPRGAPGRFLD